MKDRIEKAVELFKSGYNCSQSVVAAFADMYGFTEEQALRMSASFGGGIGRMRQTCGAACGMFLLAGLEKGAVDGKDREGKAANYALVQALAEEFKKRGNGTFAFEGNRISVARVERAVEHPVRRNNHLQGHCRRAANSQGFPGSRLRHRRESGFGIDSLSPGAAYGRSSRRLPLGAGA